MFFEHFSVTSLPNIYRNSAIYLSGIPLYIAVHTNMKPVNARCNSIFFLPFQLKILNRQHIMARHGPFLKNPPVHLMLHRNKVRKVHTCRTRSSPTSKQKVDRIHARTLRQSHYHLHRKLFAN